MGKATTVTQRAGLVKWFGAQSYEAQEKVLEELAGIFERGKAGKIKALEAELAALKGQGVVRGAAPKSVVSKPAPQKGTKKAVAAKASVLAGRKIPPKYRHPKDKTKTWAGRGVHPTWVTEYLKGGGKLDSLLIKK
ncbi:H-NS family nucleoid-associated regulatory protein [Hyphomicrobium sp. CS1BSMeth3]|uniref:H-NS histone family protein n=1 Tax=Hyphomicrobium sp. CS1BSMeth3 TaxID=1892844 RepID=UPI000930AFEF|nr:H-NS family nucleoid-associated regulatory protein [Hyphomicrobium sp. CS1BSMeth3]